MRAVRVFSATRLALPLILGVLLIPAAACSSQANSSVDFQPNTAPVVVAPPQLHEGDAVQAPAGPAVLTLTGLIGQRNDDGGLKLDADQLDKLGRVQVDVYDPWAKRDLQLQGLWLQDLVKLAEPTGGARSIHMTALDDYQVDLTIDEINAGGVLLATRNADGRPIPVEEGGPARIVFIGGVPSGASADQWIWNVTMIDVR